MINQTMQLKKLNTQKDYKNALARFEEIFQAKSDSNLSEEGVILALLIKEYEDKFYIIDSPTGIALRTLTEIKALNDFRLECYFNDGSNKIADMKPFLKAEAFKPLSDPHIFSSMLSNQGYFIEWKDQDIDLSADTLWYISANT